MEKSVARQTVLSLTTLPTLPSVLHAVVQCLEDPNSTAKDLKDIIINDQSIAVKVLNVANSAYYGVNQQVSDLRQAVVVLGFDVIRDICLYVSFGRFFSSCRNVEGFDLDEFWKHTIATAVSCRLIASKVNYENPERAMILGLIHDLGKVVLIHAFQAEFAMACRQAQQQSIALHIAEQEVLGFDHAEVGGWLAEKWDLPDILTVAVEYHHKADSFPPAYQSEVMLTVLSDTMSKESEFGDSGSPVVDKPNALALRALNMTLADYEAAKEELLEMRPAIEHLFQSSM
jgi:HD-like signal output (HDOD) protein